MNRSTEIEYQNLAYYALRAARKMYLAYRDVEPAATPEECWTEASDLLDALGFDSWEVLIAFER